MAYCTNCGAELKEGSNFCEKCGARVTGQEQHREKPAQKTISVKIGVLLILAVALLAACLIAVPGRVRAAQNGELGTAGSSAQSAGDGFATGNPGTGVSGSFGMEMSEEEAEFFAEAARLDAEQEAIAQSGSSQEYDSSETTGNDNQTTADYNAGSDDQTTAGSGGTGGVIPEYEDFAWHTDSWNGIPSDAEIIRDASEIMGVWKGLITYDPAFLYDAHADELVTVTVSGSADALRMTVQPYVIYYGDGAEDENGSEPWELNGGFSYTEAYVQGNCNILINTFYKYNGSGYAIGSLETADGIPADIVLCME